jgi:DNA polymerase III subunit epsilon
MEILLIIALLAVILIFLITAIKSKPGTAYANQNKTSNSSYSDNAYINYNVRNYAKSSRNRENSVVKEYATPYRKKKLPSDFIAFDVETATRFRHSICQIGFAVYKENKMVLSQSYLVRPPQNEYEDRNCRIHKILPKHTEDKPGFDKVWNEIEQYFEDTVIVAHNASFDLSCLINTLKYYDIDHPVFVYDCTYKKTGEKLNIVCEKLNIELDHHDSLSDAMACGEIYNLFKKHNTYINILANTHRDPDKPEIEVKINTDNPLFGKRFVLTGLFYQNHKEEYKLMLAQLGAKTPSAVSSLTDYIVIGELPGETKMSKKDEINSNGGNITELKEIDLIKLIDSARNNK